MERSKAAAPAKLVSLLLWGAFVVGIAVNGWALWVMTSEIGKELFRFAELPDLSTSTGFLAWCKNVFFFGWLPKDALHIHLSKKLVFAACNAAFLAVLFGLYTRRRRRLALAAAGLVVVNLVLIFSPAVGNLH
jgi:hypothetical protein